MKHLLLVATVMCLATRLGPVEAKAQARGAQPQTQRQPAVSQPQAPLTVGQLIQAIDCVATSCLPSLTSLADVEQMVEKRGVSFQADETTIRILKEFGATDGIVGLIPRIPPPPPPKVAGQLTVFCAPRDCAVIVGEKYFGLTEQGKKVVTGLAPGETRIQVISDGYDNETRPVRLEENKPGEEKFSLQITKSARQQIGKEALLDVVSALGGINVMAYLADVEGSGMLQWTDNNGAKQQWSMNFVRRAGNEVAMSFKGSDGECSASISSTGQASRKECKGKLKNVAESVAEQAAVLFQSYQVSAVLQALMGRSLAVSQGDKGRLETSGGNDSYVLTVSKENFPTELVYAPPNGMPVNVEYANYLNVNNLGRYPGRMALGQVGKEPGWVFTLSNSPTRRAR